VSAFFLDARGEVESTEYLTFAAPGQGGPFALHNRLPIIYSGTSPCRIIQIDYQNMLVRDLPTSFPMNTSPRRILFSPTCNGILYYNSEDHVKVIGLDSMGQFTSIIGDLDLSPDLLAAGFAISPRGDHATVTGFSQNELNTIRVETSGSLRLLEILDLPDGEMRSPSCLRYTPDGRHILATVDGSYKLVCFRIDPDTGKLTLAGHLNPGWLGWPQAMAITPDSRYVVVSNQEIPGWDTPLTLHVVRIHKDGNLEWLEERDVLVNGSPRDMEFVPFWREGYAWPQGFMLH
jgi:6-phosphogluconolactonase (cycloisomerase 2 family)